MASKTLGLGMGVEVGMGRVPESSEQVMGYLWDESPGSGRCMLLGCDLSAQGSGCLSFQPSKVYDECRSNTADSV